MRLCYPRSGQSSPKPHLLAAGVVVLGVLVTAPAMGDVIYVDQNATGPTHNGSSWCSAYLDLRGALYVAVSGDEVRVADGVYRPDRGTGSPSEYYQLISGVSILGGYAGCSAADPDERDLALHETILSGDLDGDDGPDFSNYAENSQTIIAGGNPLQDALLEGFTVSHARLLAFRLWGGNATVRQCRFVHNLGTAMAFDGATASRIEQCAFGNNRSGNNAAGASITGGAGPTFDGCRFYNNIGGPGMYGNHGRGGAVVVWAASQPRFHSCSFTGNSGEIGGAIAAVSGAAPHVVNCTMTLNTASHAGGGIYAHESSDPTITNSIVWNNSDPSGTGRDAQIHIARDGARSHPTVKYSLVEGGWPASTGYGILDTDPLFVDADGVDDIPGTVDDDISLQATSPCIDTGNDEIVTLSDFDLEGEARVQQCQVDMGADETPFFADCNSNGTADGCETQANPLSDCDENGVPDDCDPDCNSNGTADLCDIFSNDSDDCGGNGIPDECDEDCNGNGNADGCDIATEDSADCNINYVPDECDVTAGTSLDCNSSGAPDECDVIDGTSEDCNSNGVPDSCDLSGGFSIDCNGNSIPDECEDDCNENGYHDDCDLASGFSDDCTGNGQPDECDIAIGLEEDCNTNGIPDDCDVAEGASIDCDLDDIPDECQQVVVCHSIRTDVIALPVPEGGSASLYVWLATAPAAPLYVTTSITSGDPDLTISSGATLTFDAGDFDQPQPVVVVAAADADSRNGSASLLITAPGVVSLDATAFEVDDDPAPSVLYVDQNATGLSTGLSWTNAFVDLQDALEAASETSGSAPDVWVAQGVYHPDRGTADKRASFRIPDRVAVFGGFASGDSLTDRDPVAKATTLSGDLLDNDDPNGPSGGYLSSCCTVGGAPGCDEASCEDLVCDADPTCCSVNWHVGCRSLAQMMCCTCMQNMTLCDNAYHVVTVQDTGEGTTLDGFTISSGYAAGPRESEQRGAGVYISCGEVTINDCAVESNRAIRFGGGLYAVSSDGVVITGTVFNGNSIFGDTSSSEGGAGLSCLASKLTVTNCVFSNNESPIWSLAGASGGGMYNVDSDVHVIDTDFVNNFAFYQAGAAYGGNFTGCLFLQNGVDSGLTFAAGGALVNVNRIEACRFEGNTSEHYAAAVYGARSIVDSVFTGNTGYANGAAIVFKTGETVIVDRCLFENNTSTTHAGALTIAGDHLVTNSVFRGNTAGGDGGAIIANASDASVGGEIRNCTFYGNHAGGSAGGLLARCGVSTVASLNVANSILWGNTDSGGSGESAQVSLDCPRLTFDYNDVEALAGTYGGIGNFSAAPMFVDAVGGDLHLQPTSPCIDAGDSTLADCPALDVDRDPRLLDDPLTMNTGVGAGAIVDIGADEYAPPDCNDNGVPDADEIAAAPNADLNDNGTLDECEPGAADCNGDGIPDACDPDCDANGVSDVCMPPTAPSVNVMPHGLTLCQGESAWLYADVVGGESWDYQWYKDGVAKSSASADLYLSNVDANDEGTYTVAIEDDCGWTLSPPIVVTVIGSSLPPAPRVVGRPRSRYLSIAPANGGTPAAIRVTIRSSPEFPEAVGTALWIGPPRDYPEENSALPGLTFRGAMLQCNPHFQDWGPEALVHVFGGEIVPGARFDVQLELDPCVLAPDAPPILSDSLPIATGRWGDIVEPFAEDQVSPQPDFQDIGSTVAKFLAEPTAPIKAAAQLQPNTPKPDDPINFNDIAADVAAFVNEPYSSRADAVGPCVCPSTVGCGVTACSGDLECGTGLCFDGLCTDACGRCQSAP